MGPFILQLPTSPQQVELNSSWHLDLDPRYLSQVPTYQYPSFRRAAQRPGRKRPYWISAQVRALTHLVAWNFPLLRPNMELVKSWPLPVFSLPSILSIREGVKKKCERATNSCIVDSSTSQFSVSSIFPQLSFTVTTPCHSIASRSLIHSLFALLFLVPAVSPRFGSYPNILRAASSGSITAPYATCAKPSVTDYRVRSLLPLLHSRYIRSSRLSFHVSACRKPRSCWADSIAILNIQPLSSCVPPLSLSNYSFTSTFVLQYTPSCVWLIRHCRPSHSLYHGSS
jgi:hypothetical protein